MNGLDLARAAAPLTPDALAEVLEQHRLFFTNGGGGGRWQVLDVSGLPLGVYMPTFQATRGKQADLSRRNLAGLPLRGVALSWANLVAVLCVDQDLTDASLMGSLVTDGDFSGTRFDRALLRGVDLSRTALRGCTFRGADLERADLEGADLTDADLSFANLTRVKLKGATLDGVKGVSPEKLARLVEKNGDF